MDKIDINIIKILQRRGRITNIELAKINNLAPSSMLERVKRLEDKKIIKGYRACINPKAIGYNLHATVMLSLDRHQAGPINIFEDRIQSIPEVKACYHVTGRYDYQVFLSVRDIEHLGEMVKNTLGGIEGVKKQETFLALSTVKEDTGYHF